MIRIDQLWLCTAPMDMRAGAERLMSCVVKTTGAARAQVASFVARVESLTARHPDAARYVPEPIL